MTISLKHAVLCLFVFKVTMSFLNVNSPDGLCRVQDLRLQNDGGYVSTLDSETFSDWHGEVTRILEGDCEGPVLVWKILVPSSFSMGIQQEQQTIFYANPI